MSQTREMRHQMGSLVISGKSFPLYKGLNLIGRSKTATVILKNERISQHQAIITIIDENQHFLSDVFSTNRTTLNKTTLHPLNMYKLEQNSTIEFGNIVAVYKKVPGPLNNTFPLNNIENLESTQNVDDSFYAANTQALDDVPAPPISEAHHNGYFDDGYDFNNLPSPPHTTIISPVKTPISIHEMPTQLYGFIDIGNTENEIEISNTGRTLAIHDLPTQLMFNNVAANVCVEETVVHNEEISTQILNQVGNDALDDTLIPQTQDVSHSEGDKHPDISDDIVDQTAMDSSETEACNSKMVVHNRSSLTLIECTPSKETVCKSLLDNSSKSKPVLEESEKFNESKEVRQCKHDAVNPGGYIGDSVLPSKDSHLSENSQSQDIGYKRTIVRQIDSDSDPEVDNVPVPMEKTVQICSMEESGSENIGKHNRKCRKLSSDSESNGGHNSEEKPLNENIKIPSADKQDESSKIDSDSETDIELDVSNSKDKNDSGSETDIESEFVANGKLISNNIVNNASCAKLNADNGQEIQITNSETNKESYTKTDTSKLCSDDDSFVIPATQCSDNDSNDFNFMPENAAGHVSSSTNVSGSNTQGSVLNISQKLNELRQESSVQQSCTDESIHFRLTESTEDLADKGNNSEIINNNMGGQINDMPEEKDTQRVGNELSGVNNSGTNNVQGLFQSTNSSVQGTIRGISIRVNDADSNVSQSNKSLNDNADDISMGQTQKCNDVGQKLHEEDCDIFDLATQKVDFCQSNRGNEDIDMEPAQTSSVKQNIFTTPNLGKSSTAHSFSTSTPTTLNENNIFLQPTQKLDSQNLNTTELCNDEHLLSGRSIQTRKSASKEVNNDDGDIFLQPTQELYFKKSDNLNLITNDNIILQSTQKLSNPPLMNRDKPKKLAINQNIFRKSSNQNSNKNNKPVFQVDDDEEENIFLQPTQALPVKNVSIFSEKLDDMHVAVQNSSVEEDIYLLPTQALPNILLTDDKTKDEDAEAETAVLDDIYLQPMQPPKAASSSRSSLSLLHKIPDDICKDDEEESQIEVTFASQTVKLCSEVNNRPQNPLVNVLENSGGGEFIVEDEALLNESTSKKNYLEINTLPVEEMDDFQKSNTSNSKIQSKKKLKHSHDLQNLQIQKSSKSSTPSSCTVKIKAVQERNVTTRTRRKLTAKKPVSDLGSEDEVLTKKKGNLKSKFTKSSVNVNKVSSSEDIPDKSAPSTSNSDVASNISKQEFPQPNDETSVKQTRTRNRQKNVSADHTKESLPEISTTSNTKNHTKANNRKTKKADDEGTSSKIKRGKFEHNFETPKVTRNTTKRGRKLNLDQQETLEPIVVLNKPTLNEAKATVATTSSSNSDNSYEVPSPKKRRKEDPDKVVQNPTVRETRKGAVIKDNKVNGIVESKKQQIQAEITEHTNSLQTISTPERQKRLQKPKVVFTMLNDPSLESLIKRLGGSVVDTVKSCTVLVTESLKRSQKLLSAVGEGKPICSPEWLYASKKAGSFVDPWDYILYDKEAETKWNFSLKESLTRSSNNKVLANHSFHIILPNNVDVLKAAIESCGGKLVTRIPAKHADNIIVIGNPEHGTKHLKFLQQKVPLKVVTPEAIFDGVLRQELHFEDHLLS